MEAGGLNDVPAGDLAGACWSAPWFAAVAGDARDIDWGSPQDALAALNACAIARDLRTAAGLPVRFVDASRIDACAYEAHIGATGQVPTRLADAGFVHDALNALVWLRFPRVKARLNALQAREIALNGPGARRGPLRDAATLFDENAIVLAVSADDPQARRALHALRARDWRAAFVEHRVAWGRGIAPVAFGHALMQKLLQPFASITAHAWVVDMPAHAFSGDLEACCRSVDARLSPLLESVLSARAARTPLPVLGLPGWCADNAAPTYYDDVAVFRPRSGRAAR